MRTNVLRGYGATAKHARQTHCLNGHPLSGENLYLEPNGGRKCRICRHASESTWYAAHQSEQQAYARALYAANREQRKAGMKAYYAANRKKIMAKRAARKKVK
jgi:hypothetical protein